MNLISILRTQAAVALSLVSLLLTLPLQAQTPPDDPALINITNLEQLDAIRYDLNGDGVVDDNRNDPVIPEEQTAYDVAFTGVITPGTSYMGYELMKDLDFAGTQWENPTGGTFSDTRVTGGWEPIGGTLIDSDDIPTGPRHVFTATFKGNDHTISNLYINRTTDDVGLFGYVGTGGEIRKLGLVGGSVIGFENVGCLVGVNVGMISECYATGNAEATAQYEGVGGGLVGVNVGMISECYATGNATASGSPGAAGGLVGVNVGTISTCYAMGNATATGGNGAAGGLAGYNVGTISESHAKGNVEATEEGGNAGGLVGQNGGGPIDEGGDYQSSISTCYATGNATVTASGGNAGGLVGANEGTISACHATGNAEATAQYGAAGGLAGYNVGTISESHATGNAEATDGGAGGLVGQNGGGPIDEGGDYQSSISTCYATGNATASGNGGNAGGLAGYNVGTISESHAKGNVEATEEGGNAGGLVGQNSSTITACYATGTADVGGSYAEAGGLVGENDGTITACYATGNATATALYGGAGGLAGWNNGMISACYATGNATSSGSPGAAGGLVGFSSGPISACYAIGNATATRSGSFAGGLVGVNEGPISACYAIGNATATGSGSFAGGLVGENDGPISACYATGDATGNSAGGLVGLNFQGTRFVEYYYSGSISACYATGNAKARNDGYAGGLVGLNEGTISTCYSIGDATGNNSSGLVGENSGSGTIENSYFDYQTSGRQSSEIYAQSTSALQTPTTYGSGIYTAWDVDVDDGLDVGVQDGTMAGDATADDPWDFETSSQYPALQVDFDADPNAVNKATVKEFGDQPRTAAVHTITEISPTSGYVGTNVTITGTGFSATASDNMVTFFGGGSNQVVTISSTSPTALVVMVPTGAASGSIRVRVNYSSPVHSSVFTVTPPPTISSISPAVGPVNTSVTIMGTNFGATPTDNTVTFLGGAGVSDDRVATVSSVNATELVVEVPDRAASGPIEVEGGGVKVQSVDFTVQSLISITTLEQLDAMRYDLDGDGRPSLAGETAWKAAFTPLSLATVDDDDGAGDPSSTYGGYELMHDLDFAGTQWENPTGGTFSGTRVTGGWEPIGDGTLIDSDDIPIGPRHVFTATFKGNDHTISNLYINRTTDYVGLFGYVGTGGEIRKLGLVGGSVIGFDDVGCLVGLNKGTISACYATGDATATGDYSVAAGGLVGYNLGSIRTCYAMRNATATGNNSKAGGLVGFNAGYNGTIFACYATGNATATGNNSQAGGLVGSGYGGFISACYATGNAKGTGDYGKVGGLVGSNGSTVSACYATGNATATGDNGNAGGLVGHNEESTISACYATGNATATGNNSKAGGLVGQNNRGMITDSYFDYETAGLISGDAYAQSTSALQTPSAYTGIYAAWNVDVDNISRGVDNAQAVGDAMPDDVWDFGTSSQYPALKVDFDREGTATVEEFGTQIRVVRLKITTISPTSGSAGASVTISGAGFSTIPADNTVTFLGPTDEITNDAEATNVAVTSTTELVVIVPDVATTGPIEVKVGSQTAESAIFTVLSPDVLAITRISPTSGYVGTEVTIEGQNFGATASANVVTFLGDSNDNADNVVVLPGNVTASTTELVVIVPDDAVTGLIQVEVGGVKVQSDVFPVYAPNSGDLSLIDITTLEQLDAVRYDLDGDGVVDDNRSDSVIPEEQTAYDAALTAYVSVFGGVGCPDECRGYELMVDLDFAGTQWENPTGGTFSDTRVTGGWEPIGDGTLIDFR